MYKHSLSNNNYCLRKRVISLIFCISLLCLILAMILSAGTITKLAVIGNQSENNLPRDSGKVAVIDSINVRSLDDKEEVIKLRGQKKTTVIYVFEPTCSLSVRNFENIKRLVSLRGESYRILGLSLSKAKLQGFMDANKPDFAVYMNISPENARQLGMGSVPQTIVISPGGRILKNWVGAYGENLKSEVEKYFNVRLPRAESRDSCTYCMHDSIPGYVYSQGAAIKSGGRRLRCKSDGQWSAPY